MIAVASILAVLIVGMAIYQLKREGKIMASLTDLSAKVSQIAATVDTAVAEMDTLIADLKAAIAANDPTAIQAAMDALDAANTKLANAVVADAPPAAPAPAPPTP